MTTPPENLAPIDRLRVIMAKLRDPDGGCPWDLEQDFASIAPYTIEEAYEVADAIERKRYDELKDELGDLLLQVVFHSQIAAEAGLFGFDDVAAAINDKMIRRHPHVFGDADTRDSETQTAEWEAIKAAERKSSDKGESLLDDVPVALPALKRAQKLQKRAATVGFDWPTADRVLEKVDEELAEVREAMAADDADAVAEEIGDLIFVCTNLGRKMKVDVEAATRSANAKFERRFRHIEDTLAARGQAMKDTSLDAMEALWDEAKRIEKSSAEPA
ncbi:nucleoside triphosphate hydrolase [Maricaulis sp. W15]|uniref:nucleoside triphosphate pyrophosphohydrolase n=1 Tax=Maricaulis sp. W15 TaxID=1772333 RepID=UPI0009491E44|nr:nucleoside triphosphate pyrophosphohydrolase [Maricaulis sp. W15]OLF77968.1 nucleoside triphosphate hydrolase [Maricaulis sp. W15]